MRRLTENPVFMLSKLHHKAEKKWLDTPGAFYIAVILMSGALFIRFAFGICSCTLFTLTGVAAILLSVLLTGGSAYGSLSGEREKKTLDALRLTSLTPDEVMAGKLALEFQKLLMLMLAITPAIICTGAFSEYGIRGALLVIVISAFSGAFSILAGAVLSCICRSTSQSIILGWTLKLVWLLGAPLLDMVIAAVTVSKIPPPVFSSLNPLIALISIVIPQALTGAWMILPWSFIILMPMVLLLLWSCACHIYSTGSFSLAYNQRKASGVFSKGWAPSQFITRLLPGTARWFSNPAFLRELSLQIRHGAGRLPGYLVFIALFIAPYLYARSWGIAGYLSPDQQRTQVMTETMGPNIKLPANPTDSADKSGTKVIRTPRGYYFTLKGHTLKGCLRMIMYSAAGIPLPKDRLVDVTSSIIHYNYYNYNGSQSGAGDLQSELTTEREKGMLSSSLTYDVQRSIDTAAIKWGLTGAIWLLLLYIAIRGCCFTIAAVTGENERRTWEDLALSGFTPSQVLGGKLLASLALPIFQMTVVFPMMLFFVITGNLTLTDVISLYLYAIALFIFSGLLGLWASATLRTTHQAQGRALGFIFLLFFIMPLFIPILRIASFVILPGMLLATGIVSAIERKYQAALAAATVIIIGTAVSGASLSPVLAPISFLSPLCQGLFSDMRLGCLLCATGLPLLNLLAALLPLLILSSLMWRGALNAITEPFASNVLRSDLPSARPDLQVINACPSCRHLARSQ